jgi:hypothetical protein
MNAAPMQMLTRLAAFCRRASPRYSVLLNARAVTTAGTLQVTIRDLSLDGAMIQGAIAPRVGCRLLLHRRSLVVPATVVWQNGDRAGLQFDQPLSEQQLFREVDRARCVVPDALQATAA